MREIMSKDELDEQIGKDILRAKREMQMLRATRYGLSKSSMWLLAYLSEIHPRGVASTVPLPCFEPEYQPHLQQMRGLIRRGWAKEPTRGIFYITEDGLKVAAEINARNRSITRPSVY